MNRASIITMVIGALALGCGAGMVAHDILESPAVAQEEWTGQRWEHKCVIFDQGQISVSADGMKGDLEQAPVLAALGAGGWEMVHSTIWSGDRYSYCFKRPLN